MAESNQSGQITKRFHYKPFGETIATQQDDVGYTGHKHDSDLGLTYMQARYYDPVLGRFYGNDPVGYVAKSPVHSFGRYAYGNNNPYLYTDPNGKFAVAIIFAPEIAVAIKATLFVGSAATVAAVAAEANNDAGESAFPSGKGAPVDGAVWVNTTGRKGTDIWEKQGSLDDAVSDAEELSETGLTDCGDGVSTGTDANGNEIVVRPGGGEYAGGKEKGERANATIEIKPPRIDGGKAPSPTDKISYR